MLADSKRWKTLFFERARLSSTFLAEMRRGVGPPVSLGRVNWIRRQFKGGILRHQPGPRDVDVQAGPTVRGAAGDLPSRIYLPRNRSERPPALLFFHGGGFVFGDLDTHDAPCQLLAESSGCAVFSVRYRLAPEHPFPAAHQDAVAVWRWVVEHAEALGFDSARLGVGGGSAGANLAAWVAIAARDFGLQCPRVQLLIYPGTNLQRNTWSYKYFSKKTLLARAIDTWMRDQVAADPRDPRISLMLTADLRHVAPALLALAEFDPLRDEALEYAERLQASGNAVTTHVHPNLRHGFLTMTGLSQAAHRAVVAIGHSLRSALV